MKKQPTLFHWLLFIAILVTMFLMFACQEFDETSTFRIEPQLQKYFNTFKSEGERRGYIFANQNLVIQFSNTLQNGRFGDVNYIGEQRVLSIDKSLFDMYDLHQDRIEAFVFHELGHAILSRGHCNSYSIMNPGYMGSGTIYENDSLKRKQLLYELFR